MKKVSVLLSIYKPNAAFLEEQLLSLNAQTYPELELLVWNDSPAQKIDHGLFKRCITNFPVRFFDAPEHAGTTAAFGALCVLADGDYISLCDQDDIWEPDKIRLCVTAIERDQAVAAVCDHALIREDGTMLCPGVRTAGKRSCDTWASGQDITAQAAFFAYAPGMTITAAASAVKKSLPFTDSAAHDQQLLCFLSAQGPVSVVDRPLVRYRRHTGNQTGFLYGVDRKRDYYRKRVLPSVALTERFAELFPDHPALPAMRACAAARLAGSIPGLLRFRRLIPDLWRYEILLSLCPAPLFPLGKRLFARFIPY